MAVRINTFDGTRNHPMEVGSVDARIGEHAVPVVEVLSYNPAIFLATRFDMRLGKNAIVLRTGTTAPASAPSEPIGESRLLNR